MSARHSKLPGGSQTYDAMIAGEKDDSNPSWLIDYESGFFIISFGRYREFGFCCGRIRWTYHEAARVMRMVAYVLRRYKAELLA